MKSVAFSIALIALITLGLNSKALADGSITKDEVLTQICAESKTLCITLKGLNLASEGSAIRVGHQFPNSGERIMPYSFSGQLGKDKWPIDVTISRDDAGKLAVLIQDQDHN